MQEREEKSAGPRGSKRKHAGDEVRLTFSQRLAAARKRTEAASDDGDRSSLKLFNSSDAEEPQEAVNDHSQQDERFRRLYAGEVDFAALGEKDEEFQACLIGKRHIDFTDPASVMQLTKTLLKADFGLRIELPEDRLCPPVPNRHNYILWIKELLDSSSPSYSELYEPKRKVTGLDIGTGASAIYPLLGCTQRPAWSFIATDIDAKSLLYARKNVALNDLDARIRIVERSSNDSILPLDDLELEEAEFMMTNPPFYTSESELLELAKLKAQPPNSACTGAPNEMVCHGGEIGFFKRIFNESLKLKNRVQWYTTMLGKQSSLDLIIDTMREHEIDNYAVTEFVQGSKTRRWAVGWSFSNRRPSSKACRGFEPSAGRKLLPHQTEMIIASKEVRKDKTEQVENIFWTQLENVTEGLDLTSWNMDEDRLRVVGFADQNVWGRAYRRSKSRQTNVGKDSSDTTSQKTVSSCAFGFSIAIKTRKSEDDIEGTVEVIVRWLQGTDYSMFESFAGMLRNVFLLVS